MKLPRLRILVLIVTAAWGSGGCQSYRRSPLDLAAHGRAWHARDAAGAGVTAYASRLLAQSPGATTYDPADGLTLREAEPVALFFNPRLRAARLRATVAAAGAAEAGRWEDPVLGVDAERILTSVAEPWVLAGTLAVTLPLSGRLAAGKQRATAEADVERLRVLTEEQDALAELRDEWLRWSASLQRVELTAEFLKELEALAGAADRLRRAGELDPAAGRLFEIERVTQQSRLQVLEAEALDKELAIRARMGLAPRAPVNLIPQVQLPEADGAGGADGDPIPAGHPRLRLARARYELAERTLRAEVREQYPDLGVQGGYATDEGDERVLAGGSLPLPLFNGNRRGIAEARAGRDAARAEAEAAYEELASAAARARARHDAAARRLEFVRQELAPLGDRQLAEVRRLARLGDLDAGTLHEALQSAHESKLELLEAQLEASLARNGLWSLPRDKSPEVR